MPDFFVNTHIVFGQALHEQVKYIYLPCTYTPSQAAFVCCINTAVHVPADTGASGSPPACSYQPSCCQQPQAWCNYHYRSCADDVAAAADPVPTKAFPVSRTQLTGSAAATRRTAVATTRGSCPCSEGYCKPQSAAAATSAQCITGKTSTTKPSDDRTAASWL